MIEFRTLGTVDIRVGAEGARLGSLLSQPKRLGLFAYLVLSRPGEGHEREALLELFWPNTSPSRGRRALSQSLYVLRQELGAEVMFGRHASQVGIDSSLVVCDAIEFENAIGEASGPAKQAEALSSYGGELLRGLIVPDSPTFERWLDNQRIRLVRIATNAAFELADQYLELGDMVEATRWARKGSEWTPFDDSVHQRLLRFLERIGQGGTAWAEFEAFRRRLDRELDAEPLSDTRRTAERIRDASRGEVPGGPSTRAHHEGELADCPDPAAPDSGPEDAEEASLASAGTPRWKSVVAVLAVASTLAMSWSFFAGPRRNGADPGADVVPLLPGRALVTPLRDRTGDGEFGSLSELAAARISRELARVDRLQLVALPKREGLGEALAALPEAALLDTLRALAASADASLIVEGVLLRAGGSLAVQARILAASGDVLGVVGPLITSASAPMPATEELASRVAGAVARAAAHRPSGPLADGWPPLLDAWNEYVVARDSYRRSDLEGVLDHLQNALEIDSGFVLPMVELAAFNQLLGRVALADSLLAEVEARRDRLSRVDRFRLDGLLARGEKDSRASYEAWKAAAGHAPELYGPDYLDAAVRMGRYEEVVLEAERLEEHGLEPDEVRFSLAMALHALGRHEHEEAVVRRDGVERWRDPNFNLLVPALVAQGRMDEAALLISESLTDLSGRFRSGSLFRLAAREAYAHGYDEAAVRFANAAITAFEQHLEMYPDRVGAPISEAYYLAGRLEEAEEIDAVMLAAERSPWKAGIRAELGAIAARRGDRAAALAADSSLSEEPPHFEVYLWQARIRALLDDREGAVEALRNAIASGMPHWSLRAGAFELRRLVGYPPFDEILGEGGL